MLVITSDFCTWINSFQQFNRWLVRRVLRNELTVNCQVKNLILGNFNTFQCFIFVGLYNINY